MAQRRRCAISKRENEVMATETIVANLLYDGANALELAGIEDAQLEADVLLRHAMGLDDDRAHMLASFHEDVDATSAARFNELLRRRLAHEPSAYLVGYREFYGLKLECTPAALIPRPETELLVETALAWLASPEVALQRPLIIDVGTGNGALAVALAVHCPQADVVAVDISMSALRLARRNAERHGVAPRVSFLCGDLLQPLRATADIIVSNLPYVSATDWEGLPPEIRSNEPRSALVGGPVGTEAIARLVATAPVRLNRRSLLLCECGDLQADGLRMAAVAAFPEAWIEVRQDFAGLDRVLYIEQ
jgi:release factor glutamine methyltransferase